MRTYLFPLVLLACAPIVTDCASSSQSPPATGTAASTGLYVYDLARPTVDADYASRVAAQLGVHGEGAADAGNWHVVDGAKAVTVYTATGGVQYFDHSKYGEDSYTIDPSSRSDADVRAVATTYVKERGLLPDGAWADSVRAEKGPICAPNCWSVQCSFRLPAGVDLQGAEQTATLKGVVATVLVGNDEVIGLQWDSPRLTRRAAPLPDPEGVLTDAARGTDSTIGFLELTYWYAAFAENMPHLDPQGVFTPAGASLVIRPATGFRPQFTEGVSIADPQLTAGDEANIVAPHVMGGTAPYTYRWEAELAGLSPVTLSSAESVTATLPQNTVGLRVRAIDTNGMWTEKEYTVGPAAPMDERAVSTPPGGGGVSPTYTTRSLVASNGAWVLNYASTPQPGGGLVFGNVRAAGYRVADRWSMPSVTFKTTSMSAPHMCNIGASSCKTTLRSSECWNGETVTPSSPFALQCHNNDGTPLPWTLNSGDQWAIRGGQALYQKPINPNSLVSRNVYEINLSSYTATSCRFFVAQTYIMEPTVQSSQACGSADSNLCARYYPVVQYFYMNSTLSDWCDKETADYVSYVSIDQKFEQDLTSTTSASDVSLFINDKSSVPAAAINQATAYPNFAPQVTEMTGAMTTAATGVGADWAGAGSWDNYHEAADTINMGGSSWNPLDPFTYGSGTINVPGCYAPGTSSSFQCSHMHWRWSVSWLTGQPAWYGTPNSLVPGSQSVFVTVAIDHDSEYLTPGTSGLVNGETLATPYSSGGLGTLTSYKGNTLVTAVDTTSIYDASHLGKNGAGEPGGAKHYDQIGLNHYFFE